MSWFRRSPHPNAICPYCLSLTGMAPNTQATCGFCESELMRAMNFFVPLNDFLDAHSEVEMQDWLTKAQDYLKTCTTKNSRFYAKDHISSIKEVMKLKHRR